ncbi:response regulator transcription factor [Catenovulum maritimum]|uniref:Response regulatory domain-containing protein n=1 Tax=Catenovulum maritimum TaxID=1513271 RepID=A0A0J8GWA8_9ALTE|nr:response regulator [Catenovulum maritimum]KMT64978.1 hypothetical protein XM47_10830 [Catenovulum maritimum]
MNTSSQSLSSSNYNRKLLLLEDDPVFARTLCRQLNSKGFHCEHLDDVAHLLTRCAEFAPEIILLDMNLGDTNSLPYIAELRQQQPKAKIIVVTGYASIATTVTAIKSGADDYLPKPINLSSLLNLIDDSRTDRTSNQVTDESQRLSPDRLEWEYIQKVLDDNKGNISETARQLNMHRRTLQRKLAKKPTQV